MKRSDERSILPASILVEIAVSALFAIHCTEMEALQVIFTLFIKRPTMNFSWYKILVRSHCCSPAVFRRFICHYQAFIVCSPKTAQNSTKGKCDNCRGLDHSVRIILKSWLLFMNPKLVANESKQNRFTSVPWKKYKWNQELREKYGKVALDANVHFALWCDWLYLAR